MSIDKNTDRKVNTRKTLLGILGFVTVIALCIIARFVYGRYLIYELDLAYRITPMDAYYDPARIGENGYIYCDYFSLRGMYLTLCSCAYKLMGNLDGTIILLNIFIEVLAVILIWFAVKRIFGRLAAFIISIICALAPYWGEIPWFWGGTCYYILFRENRLIFLAAAFGLWILSLIVGAIRSSASGSEKPASAKPAESEDTEPVITDAEPEMKVEETEPVVQTEEEEHEYGQHRIPGRKTIEVFQVIPDAGGLPESVVKTDHQRAQIRQIDRRDIQQQYPRIKP